MKKVTGTIILATVLLAHIGVIIATEEAYTFSSSEYDATQITVNAGSSQVNNSNFIYPISSGPASITKFGLLNFDEENFAN